MDFSLDLCAKKPRPPQTQTKNGGLELFHLELWERTARPSGDIADIFAWARSGVGRRRKPKISRFPFTKKILVLGQRGTGCNNTRGNRTAAGEFCWDEL